jgi:hypothetical protein
MRRTTLTFSRSVRGAIRGKVGDLKGRNGAPGKLGMNADQCARFGSAVTEPIGNLGVSTSAACWPAC